MRRDHSDYTCTPSAGSSILPPATSVFVCVLTSVSLIGRDKLWQFVSAEQDAGRTEMVVVVNDKQVKDNYSS